MIRMVPACAMFSLVLSFLSTAARAEPRDGGGEVLTAARVAALARERAPEVRVAATRSQEARGRLTSARVFAQENPVVEAVSGRNESGRSTEVNVAVPLGFGLRRAARVGEAAAELEREQFLELDVQRRVVGESLAAFYRVLHAQERLSIARDRRVLADELQRIAGERLRTGDAPRLELLLAEAERSRAQTEIDSRTRDLVLARADLGLLLGIEAPQTIEVEGQLGDRSLFEGSEPSIDLARRVDVLAAESEARAAAAAGRMARTGWIPELAARLDYERVDDEDIVRPGLALSLPLFDQGRGARKQAAARRERAAIELDARRAVARAEADAATIAHASALAAAQEMESGALPRAVEAESLATQGYKAGKFDLPALLVIRGTALDTRRDFADRLLDAALSSIDLATALGTLP